MKINCKLIIVMPLLLFVSLMLSCILWSKFHDSTISFKGNSMVPTIKNGDKLIISPCDKIIRYDIIVFNTSNGLSCKRVIGLPSETIFIEKNKIEINGKALHLPFPLSESPEFLFNFNNDPIKVSLNDNEYFVIGDNPVHSYDSRIFGPISNTQIVGTVYEIVQPGVRAVQNKF